MTKSYLIKLIIWGILSIVIGCTLGIMIRYYSPATKHNHIRYSKGGDEYLMVRCYNTLDCWAEAYGTCSPSKVVRETSYHSPFYDDIVDRILGGQDVLIYKCISD